MADIMRRAEQSILPSFFRQWDPSRMMRWDPWRMMRSFLAPADPFAEMEAMLATRLPSLLPTRLAEQWLAPRIDVKETKDNIVLTADLPGIAEKDIEVTLSGRQLTISGQRTEEREEKEGERYYAYEREHGSFSRTFTMPEGADVEHIQADLKDGVLAVVIPKVAGAQGKRIPIGAAAQAAPQPEAKGAQAPAPSAKKTAA
jgi:HSP20 family protein